MLEAARTDLPTRPIRFGPQGRFDLRPAEYRLLVDGQPAALGGRALDLLLTLASRPAALFTKNELIERVWPGVFVEENNLRVQINALRKLLGDDVIATVPGRGYRFAAVVAAAPDAPAAAAVAVPAPAVPATSAALPAAPQRLYGRDADHARLEGLLGSAGCVTLVGPSGVGKTSLARAVMARHRARGDALGVWVDLTPLADGQAITGALARAVDAKLTDGDHLQQLLAALQGQSLLLVLDNAEHLVDACAALVAQLSPLHELRLLVTSQLPLGVAGERVQRIDTLPLHASAAEAPAMPMNPADPAALGDLGDGAIALLVARIVAADHRFVPTPAMWPLLVDICTQLDGLPLALEMAAARVPTMGLQKVRDALAQRFALLTKGYRDAATRHQTLRHAIDWSYRLLQPAEQALFRALGVFSGGFTLDLAVAVAGDDLAPDDPARWEAIDHLTTLADRSLVRVSVTDPPRYRLLDSMRAFALQRLAEDPAEQAAVRRRHVAGVAALFESLSNQDPKAAATAVPEMPNAREAIAWAREHDLALAARVSAGAMPFAAFSPWQYEACLWMRDLRPLMEAPAGAALPPAVQGVWWSALAHAMNFVGDAQSANDASRRALALWEPLQQPRRALMAAIHWVRSHHQPSDDLDEACAAMQSWAEKATDATPRERLLVFSTLSVALFIRGDYEALLEARLTELARAQEAGYEHWAEAAETNVMYALYTLGRHAEAVERGWAMLARLDALPGPENANMPWLLSHMVYALVALGQAAQAQGLVARACASARRVGTLTVLPALPGLAAALGRYEAAALLAGHARHSFRSHGAVFDSTEERAVAAALAAAVAALGAARVDELIERGAALADDAAVALVAG